jgi:hypothetical protein
LRDSVGCTYNIVVVLADEFFTLGLGDSADHLDHYAEHLRHDKDSKSKSVDEHLVEADKAVIALQVTADLYYRDQN